MALGDEPSRCSVTVLIEDISAVNTLVAVVDELVRVRAILVSEDGVQDCSVRRPSVAFLINT